MAFVGSYLMTRQAAPAPPSNPSDAAGPVLDAIEAAGPDGADMSMLRDRTGLDEAFLREVLSDLQTNGMTVLGSAGGHYQLTDFGAKARYLVAR